jgi:hypothetical protein
VQVIVSSMNGSSPNFAVEFAIPIEWNDSGIICWMPMSREDDPVIWPLEAEVAQPYVSGSLCDSLCTVYLKFYKTL